MRGRSARRVEDATQAEREEGVEGRVGGMLAGGGAPGVGAEIEGAEGAEAEGARGVPVSADGEVEPVDARVGGVTGGACGRGGHGGRAIADSDLEPGIERCTVDEVIAGTEAEGGGATGAIGA